MKSNLRGLKVGDEIFTIEKGYEPITDLDIGFSYPIKTSNNCYTYDGKFHTIDKHPSAFLTNPFNEEREVQVRDSEDEEWETRVLFKEKNGVFICWEFAETLEDSEGITEPTSWKLMREIPKLSKEDITEKLGMSIDEIKEVINE